MAIRPAAQDMDSSSGSGGGTSIRASQPAAVVSFAKTSTWYTNHWT